MFPSLDTNGYNLFDSLNPSQTSMLPSFTTHHIQNPNSHHSFPFSQDFLSNCGDESSLETQLLLQSQDVFGSCDGKNLDVSPRKVIKKHQQKKKKEKCVNGSKVKQIVPRRRTGKKDRHSKIFTAQGPRDRRMRLSLQIARKFFDLQDMLGFDKASKTIEWLFSKSKSSIKQLKESVAAANGDERGQREEDFEHIQAKEKENDETLEVILSKKRTNTIESSSKMKESREKARKRARERTMTKMKMRSSFEHNQEPKRIKITNDSNGAKVEVEVENQEQEWSKVNMEENQIDSVSIIEKFLGLNTNSSSSSIFGDSEESYTSLITSTKDVISTAVLKEDNRTSKTSTEEEKNPISASFSVYDYLCY